MPQKRHDLLLEAWREANPGMRLVLLTRPDERLHALIARLGLQGQVLLPGFQVNPYPWMRAARLLVLSSDHEGLPNVLIESLACGTPVVSTDCPSGPREILTGPLARFLVPVGDARRLAAAISDALHAPPDLAGVDLSRYSEAAVAGAWESLPARWRPH
jgi:glycosyltransferase involved in cell wall biosynthesis